MLSSSTTVIDQARVREVAGVFRSREAVDAAAEKLLVTGFDRADIDVLTGIDSFRGSLGADYVAVEELADLPGAPRQPYLGPEERAVVRAMSVAVLACAGGIGAAYGVIASGGGAGPALVAAILGCAVAGGVGLLVARSFQRREQARLARQRALGGFVIWVRVRSADQEHHAQSILRECGAEAVRVHEIDLPKRAEDLPLSSVRPDPWLGDERLGQP